MDNSFSPLADRIRPQTLSEFVGQKHLVGPAGLLRVLIENDQLVSLILWGPPGSGKTTLARVIANQTKSHFINLSAVTANVSDLRKIIQEAKERLEKGEQLSLRLTQSKPVRSQRTIVFLDEIHRFNKAQQDTLLPHVERGTIILIGATTENPSFEVIGPLLSRCRVLVLNRLTSEELKIIAGRGLKETEAQIQPKALNFLVEAANGDARTVLNAIEVALQLIKPKKEITPQSIEQALQRKSLIYDRAGEEHYNTISAFIKSMRGSDPDAALYYLARMVEAGEDPLFIARRMVIFASEDIGNADPNALPLAVSVFEACDKVGLPECRINLAQGVTYLAASPKSNASYSGLVKAEEDVRENLNEPVPLHLRNPVTKLMKEVGYGKGYRYPHNEPDHCATGETYLPGRLKGKRYYYPTDEGEEIKIKTRLEKLRNKKTGANFT